MSKKITYRTPKAEELKKALDAIIAEKEAEEKRCHAVHAEYNRMEGMYGHLVHSSRDCVQGERGYHYEYATAKIEYKEREEREQFLKENNFHYDSEIRALYEDRIAEAREAFVLEQYGMTTKEIEIRDKLKRYNKYLADAKAEVIHYEEKIAEFEKELADYKKAE